MLTSALISFLGGSAFRVIWGELSSYFQKKQDHKAELDLLRLQGELDKERSEQQRETIRLQHELGVKEIQVAGDVEIKKTEASAFLEAVKDSMKPTGYAIVDVWNGIIRPEFAQMALALWFAKVVGQGFVMDAFDQDLCCAVLGFFIADRSLGKRGR